MPAWPRHTDRQGDWQCTQASTCIVARACTQRVLHMCTPARLHQRRTFDCQTKRNIRTEGAGPGVGAVEDGRCERHRGGLVPDRMQCACGADGRVRRRRIRSSGGAGGGRGGRDDGRTVRAHGCGSCRVTRRGGAATHGLRSGGGGGQRPGPRQGLRGQRPGR